MFLFLLVISICVNLKWKITEKNKFKKLCKQLNILIYKVVFIIRNRGYKNINKYYKNINVYVYSEFIVYLLRNFLYTKCVLVYLYI